MIFSLKKLILSLIDIIIGSPTSMLFIILGIIFSVAMIINIKKNKTIGKTLYMIGWIFIISFIIIKYNNYVSKIFDNLINTIFMQIFFPNLATYTIIIITTNIIFLYTIFNKKTNMSDKLINSPFFIIIMVLMAFTVELVSKNNINVYQRKEVYSNETVITIIESTTLLFTLWMVILLSKYTLRKLIKKSSDKVKKDFELKDNEKLNNQAPIQNDLLNEPNQIPTINQTPTIQAPIQNDLLNEPNQTPIINQTTTSQAPIQNDLLNVPNQTPIINQTPTIQAPIQNDLLNEPTIPSITEIPNERKENIDIFNTLPTDDKKAIKPILIIPKKEEDIEILKL